MRKIVDTMEMIEGTPRPHYLVGKGDYRREGNLMTFSVGVNFKSEGHPSILDRTDKYVSKPHVNAEDCCFALWNAVHIMSQLNNYGSRTLRKRIEITPFQIVPPDAGLRLEVQGTEDDRKLKIRESIYSTGKFEGKFFLEDTELIRIASKYCAEIPLDF